MGFLCFVLTLVTIHLSTAGEDGRTKIYLENKCSSDVEVYVKSPGSSTTITIDDRSKKPFEFLDGTKVYDEDGRDLIVEVSSSKGGDTFVVCD